MADKYLELMVTPSVARAQEHYVGAAMDVRGERPRDSLTADEQGFIAARDSFYLATVTETGWPYIQHRGGRPGFLRWVNPNTLAFADYNGNRQMHSTGNLAVNDRVSLFLMDYPQRTRLKILGHARVEDARAHPELVTVMAEPEVRRLVERVFLLRSFRMIGTARNTSRPATMPPKWRKRLRRCVNASRSWKQP